MNHNKQDRYPLYIIIAILSIGKLIFINSIKTLLKELMFSPEFILSIFSLVIIVIICNLYFYINNKKVWANLLKIIERYFPFLASIEIYLEMLVFSDYYEILISFNETLFWIFFSIIVVDWYIVSQMVYYSRQFGEVDVSSLPDSGDSYDDMNDIDKAIEDYTKEISIDPKDANAYFLRGYQYKEKGDYDRAVADWEAALKIYPNHACAKENLERTRKERGY
jgi:tetratricopeptide (TPR) repeat protein